MNKTFIVQIEIEAPALTGENEVERAINAALDEPPCDWEDWGVGCASVTAVHNPNPPTNN